MNILKKSDVEKKLTNKEVVGFRIPRKLDAYMTLYCAAYGISKTSILKGLVKEWMEEAERRVSEEKLIKIIGKRAYDIWSDPTGKRMNFNTFKSILRTELKNKRLGSYADIIINHLENEKSQRETTQ